MFNKISTSRSATFLKVKKTLSKTLIERIFREVSKNKLGQYVENAVRKNYTDPVSAKVSFLVFKFKDEPSFLIESGLHECKFAFLLIIELDDYVIILKKHVFGVEKFLEEYCTRLDYEKIQYLYSDQNPSYEKMALSLMGISRSAILRKTLESDDLKGQLGSQSSRRSVPTNTTVKTKNSRHVLRPGSSSISKTDNRSSLNDLLGWINETCLELNKTNLRNDFLDSFAQPVNFDIIRSQALEANAILLNLSELKEILNEGGEFYFRNKKMNSFRLNSFINNLEKNYFIEVHDGVQKIYLTKLDGEKFDVGRLKINDKSITLSSPWLSSIELKTVDGFVFKFHKYFNTNQLFTITFTSPEYIYLNRKVFRDRGISAHCNEIKSILLVKDFSHMRSEKGEVALASTAFSETSIFGYLERELISADSILVCDDLGDEWADYLEFSSEVLFYKMYHCKFGKMSTSASQLHEVVAQAIKNMGRLSILERDVETKVHSWDQKYSGSQINRIRTDHSVEVVKNSLSKLIASPSYQKEIILVTPFLSKSELEMSFDFISRGENIRAHIPQLIWLLSTFVSVCKEVGIKPVIFCSQ